MSDDITLTFTKEALLERLRSMKPELEKADAKNKAKHERAEQAFLAAFKKSLHDALKWDYVKAKAMRFSPEFKSYNNPSCPYSLAEACARYVDLVERSNMKRWVIKSGGQYNRLYELLTYDVKKLKAVC